MKSCAKHLTIKISKCKVILNALSNFLLRTFNVLKYTIKHNFTHTV